MMSFLDHDEVQIVWRSQSALSASVRDSEGIVDVRWSRDGDGWDCTCNDGPNCCHVLAVRAIARAAT